MKKGVTPKENEEHAETVLRPIDQLKKVELKKTASPKVDKAKPKELESFPIEKKPSGEKLKRITKTVSPKESVVLWLPKQFPGNPPQKRRRLEKQ